LSEHDGYDKHAVQGRNGGNSRNGTLVIQLCCRLIRRCTIGELQGPKPALHPVRGGKGREVAARSRRL
jgi:hypothetical protein